MTFLFIPRKPIATLCILKNKNKQKTTIVIMWKKYAVLGIN